MTEWGWYFVVCSAWVFFWLGVGAGQWPESRDRRRDQDA